MGAAALTGDAHGLHSPTSGVHITSWEELATHHKPAFEEGTEELPLSQRGVTGHFLAALLGMPEFDKNWTTAMFCTTFVKAITSPNRSSFVRFLGDLKAGIQSTTGTPTRFISHTWGYQLHRTLRAALESPEGGLDQVYWMDIFCLNQHSSEIEHPDFNQMLRNSMTQAGHTLFVCSPWNKPVSVTRAWCLYEVMESLKPENKCVFTPVLDPEDREAFAAALLSDTSALVEIFINVDARNANAYLKEDLDMIFRWVQESVGFDEMNSTLQKGLYKWIRNAGCTEIEKKIISVQATKRGLHADEELPGVEDFDVQRLQRLKNALLEDLGRFDRVPPILKVSVLDISTLNASDETKNGADIVSCDIPVLVGTTHHHSGIRGGVLPSFLQVLLAFPDFRHDVRMAMKSEDDSKMASSPFVGELRSICDLWEKARDGVVSLDLLIDKLPTESMRLSMEAADFSEFLNTIITENEVLETFWPKTKIENVLWFRDDEGTIHQASRSEDCYYLSADIPASHVDSVPLLDCVSTYLGYGEEIEGYRWYTDPGRSQYNVRTVTKTAFWGGPCDNGRLAIVLKRYAFDFETFETVYVPTKVLLPSEISLNNKLRPFPNEKGDLPSVPNIAYFVKGVISYNRYNVADERDRKMGPGVYESYINVGGRWWKSSEHFSSVKLVSWETVQRETARTAYCILLDSNM